MTDPPPTYVKVWIRHWKPWPKIKFKSWQTWLTWAICAIWSSLHCKQYWRKYQPLKTAKLLSGKKFNEPYILCKISSFLKRISPKPFDISRSNFQRYLKLICSFNIQAELFEGRLVLNPGLNLTRVSFLLFKSIFLDNFLFCFWEHLIINLLTKRIKLNLLFKLSYLNWNFALTLGYLNPALNNLAQRLFH